MKKIYLRNWTEFFSQKRIRNFRTASGLFCRIHPIVLKHPEQFVLTGKPAIGLEFLRKNIRISEATDFPEAIYQRSVPQWMISEISSSDWKRMEE